MQKVWNVKSYDNGYVQKICDRYKISKLLAKLLISRNIAFEDMDMFLNGTVNDFRDPFDIKDMDKFVDRIDSALNNNEKIAIFGDYDVDGITSIIVLYKFLKQLGLTVYYYLPDRLVDGYGLNKEAIEDMYEKNVTVCITVDCGITAVDEVKFANELGIDMCITDHHECPEILPDAYCIVDLKRKDDNSKFKYFAGVGVTFKCICALTKKYNMPKEKYLKYLDLVALGTISDIVSLTDENRIIAKYGLILLNATKNIGLKALFKVINQTQIDSITVSYLIAPRINACGRMGDAGIAVRLLLEKNPMKAYKLAQKIEKYNIQRQSIEKEILDQALEYINKNNLDSKNSIVIYNSSWHSGVIGIVASRLVNIYSKPVILFTQEGNILKGSGRCPTGFSIYEALTKCSEYIMQFGGHDLAAGLSVSIDMIDKFKQKFEEIVTSTTKGPIPQVINIDDVIEKKDLNINTIKDIHRLKPYGQENSVPIFEYKNLKIKSLRTIKDNKHLRFTLWDSNNLIDAVAFSMGNRRDEISMSDTIDIVCQVDLNTYTRPRTIQLIIQDFKKIVT